MIGEMAGECYGSDTSDKDKNYKRGLEMLKSNHGRTLEFPDIYAKFEGYSARVIREWYTHLGGSPTRLQSSTRYIDYSDFDCFVPPSINTQDKKEIYQDALNQISVSARELSNLGVNKEDIANLLPLGMMTVIVDKRNLRNVIDMSHQRMCIRAYHEYRKMFNDYSKALREYSNEWQYIVDNYFMPKCEYLGRCDEKNSCGKCLTNKQ